jgi:hypothetical protein
MRALTSAQAEALVKRTIDRCLVRCCGACHMNVDGSFQVCTHCYQARLASMRSVASVCGSNGDGSLDPDDPFADGWRWSQEISSPTTPGLTIPWRNAA